MNSDVMVRSLMRVVPVMLCCAGILRLATAQSFPHSWTRTGGPPGATVEVIQSTANGDLWLGTHRGIFLSRDGGNTWKAQSDSFFRARVRSISTGAGRAVLAGTDQGFYRSVDDGLTWDNIPLPGNTTGIAAIVKLSDGSLVAGASGRGVLKSADGGRTWAESNSGIRDTRITSILILSDGRLMVTMMSGVAVSSDAGASWTDVTSGLTDSSDRTARDIIQLDTGLLVLGTASGVFSADPGNLIWSRSSGFPGDGGQLDGLRALAALPEGIIVAGTHNALYRSTDGAVTWASVATEIPGINESRTLVGDLHEADGVLFLGTRHHGVYRSEDGGLSWEESNSGLSDSFVHSLVSSSSGKLLAGTHTGLYESIDEGATWVHSFSSDNHSTTFAFEPLSGQLFAASNALFRRDTGGSTWQRVADFSPTTMVGLADGRIAAVDAGGAFFRSSDDGLTWTKVAELPPVGNIFMIQDMIQRRDGDLIAVATSAIYQSGDAGETWTSLGRPGGGNLLTVHAGDGQELLVAGFGGIFSTLDDGVTWTQIVKLDETVLDLIRTSPTTWLAAAESGILQMEDSGRSWRRAPLGIVSEVATKLVRSGNRLYAATPSAGVLLNTSLLSVDAEVPPELPAAFEMGAPYPNPSRGRVFIPLHVSTIGPVRFSMLDTAGRRIRHGKIDTFGPGRHIARIDMSDIAAGQYILRFESSGHRDARSVVIVGSAN